MPPRFELPSPRRFAAWPSAIAAAALHALFLLLALSTPPRAYEEAVQYILIDATPEMQDITWPNLPRAGGPERSEPARRRAGAPGAAAERAAAPPEPGLEAGGRRDSLPAVAVAGGGGGGEGADSIPGTPSPRLGSGSLWVRPLRLAELPEEVREAFFRDPSVTARLQAIFDSIRNEPGAEQALPSWAVDIPGVGRAGIDSGWITLGPIRIPAAVLALIPLPVQGNFEEAERAERLAEMRADLLRAAQRAATVEEFKRAVQELRERKQRERDAERARRGRDTIIP